MSATMPSERVPVPRDKENDYTREAAERRAEFVRERTGAAARARHELLVRPEARRRATSSTSSAWPRFRSASPARCWSTASTRRASSTSRWPRPRARWWRATTAACGSCTRPAASTTTIIDDRMQRAPAFLFESAREARDFDALARRALRRDQGARPRRRRARASSRTSSATRPAASSTRASTTRRATPPART